MIKARISIIIFKIWNINCYIFFYIFIIAIIITTIFNKYKIENDDLMNYNEFIERCKLFKKPNNFFLYIHSFFFQFLRVYPKVNLNIRFEIQKNY